MSKKKLIDFLILFFAYLVCSSFPFGLFIHGDAVNWLIPLCQFGMQVIFTVFWIFFTGKSSLKQCKVKANMHNYLLFLPIFVIPFSNFLFAAFVPESYNNTFDWTFAIKVFLTFIVVCNEEFLFRFILLGNMDKISKPIYKIVISAGLFAICHIGTFLTTFNPGDLLPVLYTFGLGLVLGLLYMYAGAPCTCICFHLLFNLLNGVIFGSLFNPAVNYNAYILVNVFVAFVFTIYFGVCYFAKLRKSTVTNIEGEIL